MIFNKALLFALKSGGKGMSYWPFIKPNTSSKHSKVGITDKPYFVSSFHCYGVALSGVTTSLKVYLPSGELLATLTAQPIQTSNYELNSVIPTGTRFVYSHTSNGGAEWGFTGGDVIWEEIPELTSGGGVISRNIKALRTFARSLLCGGRHEQGCAFDELGAEEGSRVGYPRCSAFGIQLLRVFQRIGLHGSLGGILRGDLFGHANLGLSVYDDGRSNLRDSDVRKSERVERHASRYGRNHSDGEYLPLHSAGIFQRFGRGQNHPRRDRRVSQISFHKEPISQCAYAAC